MVEAKGTTPWDRAGERCVRVPVAVSTASSFVIRSHHGADKGAVFCACVGRLPRKSLNDGSNSGWQQQRLRAGRHSVEPLTDII
jgi:hypothetical protein